MPFGWKGWVAVGLALLLIVGFFQFAGAIKTWWAHRGIDQANEAIREAKKAADIARAEAARAATERAQALKEIGELKRQRDQAIQNANRERAEASRLAGVAADLERKRQEAPKVVTLEQARQTFRELGYGAAP